MDYENFTTFDLPIVYKELSFIPVSMKDYFPFMYFSQVLTIEKDDIPDPKVISMKYLEYLFYAAKSDNDILPMLDAILRITTRKTDSIMQYSKDSKGKYVLVIDGSKYDSNDFEEIRKIICIQNDLQLPDTTMQKKIRERLADYERLLRKKNGSDKPSSIEDLVIALTISSSLTLKDIYEMPIRKFFRAIKRVDAKLHYQIMMTAKTSGFVKFRDDSAIKHWLSSLDVENRGFMSMEEAERKMNPTK